MARRHSPAEQYRQAQQMAHDHNLLISERPGKGEARYFLYRKTDVKPVYLGQATGAGGLFRLVSKFSH